MTLGQRIRACRQNAGMSQEKIAELIGVSRQAVTKWERDQSAPNTENLLKLAEIFGTTADLLLASGEEAKKTAGNRQARKRNVLIALLVAAGYMGVYLIGRLLWCDRSQSSLLGWLFTAIPSGEHSYLYGWLLSSELFWYAMAISVLPACVGKHRFSCVTLMGFLIGLAAGMLFGPNPEGAALGAGDYGWAIWGASYLVSIPAGIVVERYRKVRK